MSEPPSAPDSPRTAAAAGTGSGPSADFPPHLLVMPAVEGAPPAMAWPGPEGQPAWAIPVSVPPGTRGYAIFIPLVPVAETAATALRTIPAQSPSGPSFVPAAATPGDAAGGAEIPMQVRPAGTTDSPASAGTADAGTVVPSGTAPGTAGTAPVPAGPDAEAAPTDTDPQPDATTGTPRDSTPTTTDEPAPTESGTPTSTAPGPARQGFRPPDVAPGPQPGGPLPAPAPHPGFTAAPAHPGPIWAGHPPQQPQTWAPRPRQPRTSFLGAKWPGPKPATGRAAPAAVLAGALGIAFFVPLSRTGIGWFLGWLVLTAGVLGALRRHTADLPRAERLARGGWAVAALALLSVLAFRNAWWLVTFCVLGALGCATLAIVGGRLVRSILFSLVAAPFAAFRGLPWVRRHLKAPADAGIVRRVVGSVIATVVVLLVFGALLSSADAAFSQVLDAIVPEISISAVFRGAFLAAVGGLIAVAAVYTLAAPPDLSEVDRPTRRSLGLVEWAPPIAALTALFAGFVAVQFTVLFGGQRHVLKTAGLSYAEYARSGFWQLLFVTLLTVAVLGGVSRWARRERPVERNLLRILLGLLSVLSVVIVVSALSRMYTYQKVYSFTGERIFVMAFELLLGAVFVMILAAGIRWRGRWIPGTTVGLAVVMLLSLAVLNPEDYAARRNIVRYQQTGKIDAWYLRALSADATPAMTKLPDPVRRCTLSWIADDLAEPDPWYAWNLGRYRARQALDRIGEDAIGGPKDCRKADQFDLPKSRRTR